MIIPSKFLGSLFLFKNEEYAQEVDKKFPELVLKQTAFVEPTGEAVDILSKVTPWHKYFYIILLRIDFLIHLN